MVGNDLSSKPIKFLCSYGGRILPRYPDGKLRYHGGDTRVLSVERSLSFSDLLLKLVEMCGTAVSLRCQLPTEDLDALVSITSDEDLANLVEEYDRAAPPPLSCLKIRAFLSAPKPTKKISPPSSTVSSTSPKSPFCYAAVTGGVPPRCPSSVSGKYIRHASRPPQSLPSYAVKAAGKSPYHQLVKIPLSFIKRRVAASCFQVDGEDYMNRELQRPWKSATANLSIHKVRVNRSQRPIGARSCVYVRDGGNPGKINWSIKI